MKILVIAIVAALVCIQVFNSCTQDEAPQTQNTPTIQEQQIAELDIDWYSERVRAENASQARVERLTQVIETREKEAQALAEAPMVRQQIFNAKRKELDAIVDEHMETYLELVEVAKKQPNGKTYCTICNASTYLPCIYCNHKNDGKCSKCSGTGEHFIGLTCPACLGTGKCHQCSGMKRMFCPFCDDGEIDIEFEPGFKAYRK